MSEPHTTAVAAAVVLPNEDRVLLVRREDGAAWALPQAALAQGEDVQRAAQRAVLEATGVPVALANLVGIYSGAGALLFVFSAYIYPGHSTPAPGVAALGWLAPAETEAIDDALLQRILADARRGIRYPLGMFGAA